MKVIFVERCRDCPHREFAHSIGGDFIRCGETNNDITTEFYMGGIHKDCPLENHEVKQ